MRSLACLATACVLLAGCHCDGLLPPGSIDPPPPHASKLPKEIADALPRNDAGLPILFPGGEAVPGWSFGLVFDESLDDPIARWGECLGRVSDCYQVNAGRPVTGCIGKLERCADDSGGKGCCPPACFTAFDALRKQGVAEDEAVDRTFLEGGCVQGFAEQVDGGGVTP